MLKHLDGGRVMINKILKWISLSGLSLQAVLVADVPDIQLVETIPVEVNLTLSDGVLDTKVVWLDMIRNANKSIDISQFYMLNKDNESLEAVVQELEKAAKRGVKIRLLADSLIGADELAKPLIARLQQIQGLTYRPIDYMQITDGVMHAKYWVIDEQIVFVGSADFAWQALEHIYETGLLINNAAVAKQFEQIFEMDWALAVNPHPVASSTTSSVGTAPSVVTTQKTQDAAVAKQNEKIEVVASPPTLLPKDVQSNEGAVLGMIRAAKNTIRIIAHNYTPIEQFTGGVIHPQYWPAIDDALREAALIHNVKVELMVSDANVKSPLNLACLKSLAAIPGITIKVVTIPPSSKGPIQFGRFMDGRFMTIDGIALWLGTSQWTESHFKNSRNVDVIVRDPVVTREADASFNELWKSQYAKNVLEVKPA